MVYEVHAILFSEKGGGGGLAGVYVTRMTFMLIARKLVDILVRRKNVYLLAIVTVYF